MIFWLVLGLLWVVGGAYGAGVWPPPPLYECPKESLYPCRCESGSDSGVSVVCDNTNLASLAVGLRQLNIKIANLTVSNCNIEKLYGDVFRPLNISRLVISDTPIREIANDTFLQVGPSIKSLEIINSRLETFPTEALQTLENVELIKIEKSDLTAIPANAFRGLSNLLEIEVSHSSINFLEADSFSGQRNLKFLRLNSNNLTDLDSGAIDFGQSLELLDLAHNRISKLKPDYFIKLAKLLWLNLTDNGIDTFDARVFGRNQLLAVLQLGSNSISRLDGNSFRGMRFMRRLYFEDNQISSIGRQTFQNLRRIGGIYLSGNKLKQIDFQMFADLNYADTIDVSNNLITKVEKGSFGQLYLTNINMSHNSIEELPAGVFVACDNISLDLSYNKLRNIHEDAFDELSYTFVLNASHNLLTNFSQVPMKYQKGITVLDLSYNLIQDIPRNSFPKLYELHTILLHHNNLTDIYRSVFTPLFSVRLMDFSYNSLETIDSAAFGKLPTLLELDLSHNQLKSIRRGAFDGLNAVRDIRLDFNQLEEIPRPPISLNHLHLAHNKISEISGKQPWPVMNSIISLDLDHNLLGDNLGPGRFDGLITLQNLSLRHNAISKPPWEALGSLQSLRILNLDYNEMVNLDKAAFGKLPVVSDLTLSGNKITNISMRAFEGLLNLVNLDLSGNQLTYIPPGAFFSLVALRKLTLSHNRLQKLENKTHGLLEDCLSLRYVDLSYNDIPFITKKMFPESRWIPYKLEHIDLSFNTIPVLTDGILVGTKFLKYLNLSHNILNDIRAGVLGNLSSLEVLDLSYNVLQDEKLRSDRWGGVLANLTYLNLAHNQLYNIPAKHLAQFSRLRSLDLSGNDIIHYYPVFTTMVKAGLDIRYQGNLLRCECSLRPIIHWVRAGDRRTSWDEAICNSPAYLKGRPVSSVREEQLVCDNSAEAEDFKISPDVQFRKVDETKSSLALSWFVNTNEDVGDFRLELASLSEAKPKTLLVKDISYNTRYDVVDHIPTGEELRMCLLVKTSLGRIRRWRQDQCQEVGPFRSSGSRTGVASLTLLLLLNPLVWLTG